MTDAPLRCEMAMCEHVAGACCTTATSRDWRSSLPTMGVSPDTDWLGRLYQSANRLACLYFLREIGKVDALLANVYFTGDPHSPTTRQQRDEGIRTVSEQLGIASPVPYRAAAFLEATR